MENTNRAILLVDDEENILSALVRVLRREGYRILTASGGKEGLKVLGENAVGVIVSDQRMPEMTGVEFLSRVRDLYPATVRIMLSGYTELDSVADAINRGAIYKFLTKPWDDELLLKNIREAFEYFELKAENTRLTERLKEANTQLERHNRKLAVEVREMSQEAAISMDGLHLSQRILQSLPIGILGIGPDGMVVMSNGTADIFLANGGAVGRMAGEVLSEPVHAAYLHAIGTRAPVEMRVELPATDPAAEREAMVRICPIEADSMERGVVVMLIPWVPAALVHEL